MQHKFFPSGLCPGCATWREFVAMLEMMAQDEQEITDRLSFKRPYAKPLTRLQIQAA
jgi:hypothetical protein